MTHRLYRSLFGLAAVAVLTLATPTRTDAAFVAVIGFNNNSHITTFLNASGHTATNFGGSVPGSLAGFDAVVLLRTSGNATLQNFVLGGGLLITEWDESVWALNAANLLNAVDVGGGLVGTGTPVSFTVAGNSSGLSTGLSPSYSDGGATEFFRSFSGIGAGVDVLATRPGGVPAILGGASGAGATVIIGYDWADDFQNRASPSGTLLLNALNYNPNGVVSPVPVPSTLLVGVLGALSTFGLGLKRRTVRA